MATIPIEKGSREGLAIWAARFVALVAFLDLFMQLPTVPPYARSLGSTDSLVGVIVAVYSATNLFGNVVAGVVIDRLGRRGPVLAALLATCAILAAYALAQTPGHLMAFRAVHGLAVSVLAPGAFAMIGDRAASEGRGRAMGVSGAIIAGAAMVGPPSAGLVRDALGFSAVFLLDSGLMLAAFGVFWYATRGTALFGLAPDPSAPRTRPRAWGAVVQRPVAAAYATMLSITVGVGVIVTYLPLVLSDLGASATRMGTTFTAYAVVSMVVMASPLSRVGDIRGRAVPLAAGLGVAAAGLAALGALPGATGATIGMAVFGLGYGLVFPAAAAQVAEATGPTERGTAFGLFYALFSLGVIVGAVLSGVVSGLVAGLSGAPFFAAVPVVLVAVPAALRWASPGAPLEAPPLGR